VIFEEKKLQEVSILSTLCGRVRSWHPQYGPVENTHAKYCSPSFQRSSFVRTTSGELANVSLREKA
jgi:hypothetical protein